MPKTYDYKALIHTFINTRRTDFPHEDFTIYYVALLNALEDAFGITFVEKDIPDRRLWMLFRSTLTSYLNIRHPWSGYLDGSGILIHLKSFGEAGEQIKTYSDQLFRRAEETRQIHLDMLYQLFEMIYGRIDTVITSDDLYQRGFDDSTEPQIPDYYDYM